MDEVAKQLIEMERAALDRWIRGDTDGYADLFAPELTYFDTYLDRRIDDRAAFRSHIAHLGAIIADMLKQRRLTQMDSHQMVNPKVERSEDMAVLSYDWEAHLGHDVARWRATDVYRKTSEGWRIVHAHWSLVQPRPTVEPR